MVGYRRLRDIETPREFRRRRRSPRKYRCDRVTRRVSQGAENRFGIYCTAMFGAAVACLRSIAGDVVGCARLTHDRKVESDSLRACLVLRPPPPGVERGRNDVAAVDTVVLDRRPATRSSLSSAVVKGHWKIELIGQIAQ